MSGGLLLCFPDTLFSPYVLCGKYFLKNVVFSLNIPNMFGIIQTAMEMAGI